MATATRFRFPSLRLYKPSGRAVVTIHRRDFYLGKYGSQESLEDYKRLLADAKAHGVEVVKLKGLDARTSRSRAASNSLLTVSELLLAFLEYVEGEYAPGNQEIGEFKTVIREHFGSQFASDFRPHRLATLRQAWIEKGLCRSFINKKARRVVRVWAWGVENELVPPDTWHSLQAVKALRYGRRNVKESRTVHAISEENLQAVLAILPKHLVSLCELLYLTGARPGELTKLRTCDIVRDTTPWQYEPEKHKNTHRRKKRVIFFGPRARAILANLIDDANPDAYFFSPQKTVAALKEAAKSPKRTESRRKKCAETKRRARARKRKEKTGRSNAKSPREA